MAYSDKGSRSLRASAQCWQPAPRMIRMWAPASLGRLSAGDVMRLQMKINPENASHRRGEVQNLRLRIGDCQFFAGDRVGQGQDGPPRPSRSSNTDIVRELSLPPREDSLFGPG